MTILDIPETSLLRLIRRFYRGPRETVEDLAHDLWMVCFENKLLPSARMARNLVADHLRHQMVEESGTEKYLRSQPEGGRQDPVDRELVGLLIDQTPLSEDEKNILFLRFWKDLTILEIEQMVGSNPSPVLKLGLEKLLITGLKKGWFS